MLVVAGFAVCLLARLQRLGPAGDRRRSGSPPAVSCAQRSRLSTPSHQAAFAYDLPDIPGRS